jgi:pseudoazurin
MQLATVALALALLATPTLAADHQVKMLLSGTAGPTVFEPSLINVAVGDTVTFVPSAAMQNAQTIPGMLPAGAAPFEGGVNEAVTVTFDVPGTYGVECKKHFGIGMVALVVVGDATADATVVADAALPFRARERFQEMLEAKTQ